MKQAIEDYALPSTERIGLMHCFCLDTLTKNPKKFFDLNFKRFGPDQPKHCEDWLKNYTLQKGLIVGTSLVVVVINIIICMIFEALSKLEKHHTQNDETLGMF